MTSKTKIEPATNLAQGDTITVPLRVLDVKASDHSYFGPHDIVTVEVSEATGELPVGLRFQIRRPHDGSSDLRSSARKDRGAATGAIPSAVASLPQPTSAMTLKELVALADARGVDTGSKPTKAALLESLGA
jgi:hypothetical protein